MGQRYRSALVPAAALLGGLAVAQSIVWPPRAVIASGSATAAWQLVTLGLLGLASTLPVAASRVQPAAAAVTVAVAGLLSLAAFRTLTVAGLIALLAVQYRLGRSGSQPLAAALALPFLVFALVIPALGWPGLTGYVALLAASLGPAAAWAGAARRYRSEAVRHSAARQAIAGTLLEHSVRGERARISRELHDVVAHHISMIAVQAETARLATPGMPAAGAQRLTAIGDTARAALTEMRRMLGVLREDTETTVAERRPQPGLAQLNELLDEVRDASGTGLRLIVRGWLTTLDPGVELAAYRIIQEALTNARRHAPGAAVDVELRYDDDTLWLRIRDNGPGPAEPARPGGHGLLGMRERAMAVGGELRTSGSPGGGFLVEASLPVKADSAA